MAKSEISFIPAQPKYHSIGMKTALTFEDAVSTVYRNHGTAYCRGDTSHGILTEMMGKNTGSSNGKGGSMHYYEAATNFFGGNGIVGAQVRVGAGLGLPNVTMFWKWCSQPRTDLRSLEHVSLMKAPCDPPCENNLYTKGPSDERTSANTKFFTRGDGLLSTLATHSRLGSLQDH
jgi:pyruvate dehydrogenase E1 component alpha subunit